MKQKRLLQTENKIKKGPGMVVPTSWEAKAQRSPGWLHSENPVSKDQETKQLPKSYK
jgi:hypothetical protein